MRHVSVFILLLTLFFSSAAHADVLRLRVVDADSGEPMESVSTNVFVHYVEGYGVMYDTTTDSLGVLYLSSKDMVTYTLEFKYFGYDTLKKKYNVPGGKDTLDVGDVKMHMSEFLMKELRVEAKARRFYMKGDTVVFNPEAFNLDDGDRVATLLKKLPGVSIEDGKLKFNGKEVHLKMNGHFVGDDYLTSLLPAEAVKDIKAYEQQSESAELTGMRDGEERQVLDITIKPGFMDKWYGRVTGSAYASPNYRASVNSHYLSDSHPFHVYLRTSDNAETGGAWGEHEYSWGETPKRQQAGKVEYRHNWKRDGVESSYDDTWGWSLHLDHVDRHQHNWETTKTLMSGVPSVFSNSKGYEYNHSLELPFNIATSLHLAPKTTLDLSADAKFYRHRDEHSNEGMSYRAEEYSEEATAPTNTRRGQSLSESTGGDMRLRYDLRHVWHSHVFSLGGNVHYVTEDKDGASHTEIDYVDMGTQEVREQTNMNKDRRLDEELGANLDMQLVEEKVKLGVSYRQAYNYFDQSFENTLNGAMDWANTGTYNNRQLHNEGNIGVKADLGDWFLSAETSARNIEESTLYQRGKLDTTAHRNYWKPRVRLSTRWRPRKGSEINVNGEWSQDRPDLMNCLGYTDDTNPLYVRMGNPLLRGTSKLGGSLSYKLMLTRGSQMLSVNCRYNRAFHPVRSMLVFNPLTGAYISSTGNVDRADNLYSNIIFDRSLGDLFRFTNRLSISYDRNQNIQTRHSLTEPVVLFRQTDLSFVERPYLTFENKGWEATLGVYVQYKDVRYDDPTLQSLGLWNYETELMGKYKWKQWVWEASATMDGARGYLSPYVNRERYALNASVSWKCLKNKGLLTLAAKDILGQMDGYNSYMTESQQIELYNETFHRHVSLTFTYNFDSRPGKGK